MRSRVLGVLALLGVAVLGMGGQGTFAFWNDSDTVIGGTFTAGKLDLTVDGQQGNPTAYAKTNLALSAMVPGESVASTLALANAGDADLTYVATVTKAGALAAPLSVELYAGSTETGDDATYPRTEGCTSTATPITSGSTATRLNRGASQNVCVKVTLPPSTDTSFQSASSGSVTLTIVATQVVS